MATAGAASSARTHDLTRLILAFAIAKLLLHVTVAALTPYEFHRDELLYFSMGTHLRLFHMDFPPLIALLSELLRHSVGVSVFTYRVIPGIAGTGVLLLALGMVRALGGGRGAVVLTSVALLSSVLFLRTASLFQPVVLDQLAWMAALYALLRLEQTDDPRWWGGLGLAGGIGLLTKFSIGFIGVGILAAVLLTRRRRALFTPYPWMALGIALLVGSPSIIGQVRLGFPVVGQLADLRAVQLGRINWVAYLSAQPLMMGPAIALALAGAVAPWRDERLRAFRSVAIACVTTFVLLGVLHGKPYYAGPVFPALSAAGAVWIDGLTRPRTRAWVVRGVILASAVFAGASAPLGLPILPPAPMARYAAALGVTSATRTNTGGQLPLPQDYADMVGWREKAEAVAAAVASLTTDERRRTVLYGDNYGQAGALDLYGRRLGLPPVVSLTGSFYFFGPGTLPGDVLVTLGVERADLETVHCDQLDAPTRVKNPWGVEEERDVPILVCRGLSITLQELWRDRAAARKES